MRKKILLIIGVFVLLGFPISVFAESKRTNDCASPPNNSSPICNYYYKQSYTPGNTIRIYTNTIEDNQTIRVDGFKKDKDDPNNYNWVSAPSNNGSINDVLINNVLTDNVLINNAAIIRTQYSELQDPITEIIESINSSKKIRLKIKQLDNYSLNLNGSTVIKNVKIWYANWKYNNAQELVISGFDNYNNEQAESLFSQTGLNIPAFTNNTVRKDLYIEAQVQAVCEYNDGTNSIGVVTGENEATRYIDLQTGTIIPKPAGVSNITCDDNWNLGLTCDSTHHNNGSNICVSNIRACWQEVEEGNIDGFSKFVYGPTAPTPKLGTGTETYSIQTGAWTNTCIIDTCKEDYYKKEDKNISPPGQQISNITVCAPVAIGQYAGNNNSLTYDNIPSCTNAKDANQNPLVANTFNYTTKGGGANNCKWKCKDGYSPQTDNPASCTQNKAELATVVRLADTNNFSFTNTKSTLSANRLEEVNIAFGYVNFKGSNATFTATYTYKENIVISPSFFKANPLCTGNKEEKNCTININLKNSNGTEAGTTPCTINENTRTIACTITNLAQAETNGRYFEIPFLVKTVSTGGTKTIENIVSGNISNSNIQDVEDINSQNPPGQYTSTDKNLDLTLNPANCPYSFDNDKKVRIDRTSLTKITNDGSFQAFFTNTQQNDCSANTKTITCNDGKFVDNNTNSEVTFDTVYKWKNEEAGIAPVGSSLNLYGTCFNNCLPRNLTPPTNDLHSTSRTYSMFAKENTDWNVQCSSIKKEAKCYDGKYYDGNLAISDTNPNIVTSPAPLTNHTTTCNDQKSCAYGSSTKQHGDIVTFYKSEIPYGKVCPTDYKNPIESQQKNELSILGAEYSKKFTCQNGAWVETPATQGEFVTDDKKKLSDPDTNKIYTLPGIGTENSTTWKESCSTSTARNCNINGTTLTHSDIATPPTSVIEGTSMIFFTPVEFVNTCETNGNALLWCYDGQLKATIAGTHHTVSVTPDVNPTSAGASININNALTFTNSTPYYSYCKKNPPANCGAVNHGDFKTVYNSNTATDCSSASFPLTCYNGLYYDIPSKQTGTNWTENIYTLPLPTAQTGLETCRNNCETDDKTTSDRGTLAHGLTANYFLNDLELSTSGDNNTCTDSKPFICDDGVLKQVINTNTQIPKMAFKKCKKEVGACRGSAGFTIDNSGTPVLSTNIFSTNCENWKFQCSISNGIKTLTINDHAKYTGTMSTSGGQTTDAWQVNSSITPTQNELNAFNAFNSAQELYSSCIAPLNCVSSINGTIISGETESFSVYNKVTSQSCTFSQLKCENGYIVQVNNSVLSKFSRTKLGTSSGSAIQNLFWYKKLYTSQGSEADSCRPYNYCRTTDGTMIPHGNINLTNTVLYFKGAISPTETLANAKFSGVTLRCNDGTFQREISSNNWQNITLNANAIPPFTTGNTAPFASTNPQGVYYSLTENLSCKFYTNGNTITPQIITHGSTNSQAFYFSPTSSSCANNVAIPVGSLKCNNGYLTSTNGTEMVIQKDDPGTPTNEEKKITSTNHLQVSTGTSANLATANGDITSKWYSTCADNCMLKDGIEKSHDDASNGVEIFSVYRSNTKETNKECLAPENKIDRVYCDAGKFLQVSPTVNTSGTNTVPFNPNGKTSPVPGIHYSSCRIPQKCDLGISINGSSTTTPKKLELDIKKTFYTKPTIESTENCSSSTLTLVCRENPSSPTNTGVLKKVNNDDSEEIWTPPSTQPLYYFGSYSSKQEIKNSSDCPKQCVFDGTWNHLERKDLQFIDYTTLSCPKRSIQCVSGVLKNDQNKDIVLSNYIKLTDECNINGMKDDQKNATKNIIGKLKGLSGGVSSNAPLSHMPFENIKTDVWDNMSRLDLRDKSQLVSLSDKIKTNPNNISKIFPTIPSSAQISINIRAKLPPGESNFYNTSDYLDDTDQDIVVVRWEVRGVDKEGKPITLTPFFQYGDQTINADGTTGVDRNDTSYPHGYGCGNMMLCLDDFKTANADGYVEKTIKSSPDNSLYGKIQSSNESLTPIISSIYSNSSGVAPLSDFLSNANLGVQFPEIFIFYEKKLGIKGSVKNIDYQIMINNVAIDTKIPTGSFLVTAKGKDRGFRSDLEATFSHDTIVPIFNYVLFQE